MKKGIIIGLSIVLGLGAIAGIIVLIVNLTKFAPRTDGYIVPEGNYGRFITQCMADAYANKNLTGDYKKQTEVKPYKTGYYTEDGFPIWAVGENWPAYENIPVSGSTWRCYLGTNETTAYALQLEVNGETTKTYNSAKTVNEKGEESRLTNHR